MNSELAALLERGGGLVTRTAAVQVVPPWVVEHACRRGALHRVLPGVYRDPAVPATPQVRRQAVLAWLDGRGALSHTTALAVWGLHQPAGDDPVHVTVPASVRLRSRPGVEIHRRAPAEPLGSVVRSGQPVTPLERSLVDSWPLLSAADRRAPVIQAVNERRTTPRRLLAALGRLPRLAGRAELRVLLDLLAAGCLSPLEIWGHQHVFTGAGMPAFRRQVRVRIGSRAAYLDVYAEAERVDFELDGASAHGTWQQREADLRRDALLATLGILVVRFTHYRLVYETEAVRREVRAILAARRAAGLPA